MSVLWLPVHVCMSFDTASVCVSVVLSSLLGMCLSVGTGYVYRQFGSKLATGLFVCTVVGSSSRCWIDGYIDHYNIFIYFTWERSSHIFPNLFIFVWERSSQIFPNPSHILY